MPRIRAILDFQKPTQREVWLPVTDCEIDHRTGLLILFRMHFQDGSARDYHLFHRDISLFDVAVAIFGGATSLRSAKGLLQDLSDAAGKRKWKSKAGVAGLTFGTVALLHEFLKTQPFRQEGYYDGSGNLYLGRIINAHNRADYDPN